MASDSSWIKICNKVLNEVGHSEIIQIQGYVYTYANFQNFNPKLDIGISFSLSQEKNRIQCKLLTRHGGFFLSHFVRFFLFPPFLIQYWILKFKDKNCGNTIFTSLINFYFHFIILSVNIWVEKSKYYFVIILNCSL